MYYTYMLRCEDNTIYTGITSDINRRMNEHFHKNSNCAKYTRTHTAKKLEAVWQSESRVLASRLEFHIKRLSKEQKEKLISQNKFDALKDKIDCKQYRRVNNLSVFNSQIRK